MKLNNIHIVTMQWDIAPLLSTTSYMPYTFPNGSSVDELTLACPECKKDVPPYVTKGIIKKINKSTLLIRGLGKCVGCTVINKNVYFKSNAVVYESDEKPGWGIQSVTEEEMDRLEDSGSNDLEAA